MWRLAFSWATCSTALWIIAGCHPTMFHFFLYCGINSDPISLIVGTTRSEGLRVRGFWPKPEPSSCPSDILGAFENSGTPLSWHVPRPEHMQAITEHRHTRETKPIVYVSDSCLSTRQLQTNQAGWLYFCYLLKVDRIVLMSNSFPAKEKKDVITCKLNFKSH